MQAAEARTETVPMRLNIIVFTPVMPRFTFAIFNNSYPLPTEHYKFTDQGWVDGQHDRPYPFREFNLLLEILFSHTDITAISST